MRHDPAALRRVLIVRHDRIGDWVVTTPVVALMRELAPACEIDVLASPANAGLVRADGRVTRVVVNDRSWRGWLRALRELRARRYDLVISTIYGKHLREGLVAAMIATRDTRTVSVFRPRRYQGFFSAAVRVPRSWSHMVERMLYVAQIAVVGTALPRSESVQRWHVQLASDAAAEQRANEILRGVSLPFAAVNLSAAEPHREWSAERCAETLTLLLEAHDDVMFVLTPPPGRQAPCDAVLRLCASPRVLVAPPSPRLIDLVAILRRSHLVITPDTANVHLASAAGRPVLGLYTPGPSPVLWAPFGVPFRIVMANGGTTSDVSTSQIVTAFDELWAQVPRADGRVSPRSAG